MVTNEFSANPDVSRATVSGLGDADLVVRTRGGDPAAFGELWRRHYRSGITVARSITSAFDADDLVQEAYAKIYQAIQRGSGPNGSFRAYLFTSVRNAAASWGRSHREWNIDELDAVIDPASTDDALDDALDQSLTTRAFRSLPTRWQEVLWYSEVEQLKPNEIAPLLGMSAGAVSQLAFRAREGLREAWIQAHLSDIAPDSNCQWTVQRLAAHARGNLGTRDSRKLEAHLDECDRCLIVAAEAKHVSDRLALVLLPLVLGTAGASGYAAALQSGSTATVALAAMPSNVMPDVVVAGSGAGAGSGATGSGGATATAGTVTGMGVLVGAGAAALVIAGAIVASAVVPGLVSTSSATSAPVAGALGSTGIVTEVSPAEDAAATNPLVLQPPNAPRSSPRSPKSQPLPTPDQLPANGNQQIAVPTLPTAAPTPPMPPEEVDPEEVDPEEPGPEEPGPEEPGEDGNGNGDGNGEPTDPSPLPPAATLPSGTPTVGEITAVCAERSMFAQYLIAVSGEPGATVQVLVNGSAVGTAPTQLDASGLGAIELRPTITDWLRGHLVQVRYITETEQGTPTAGISIRDLADVTLCLPPATAPAPAPAPAPNEAPDTAPVEMPEVTPEVTPDVTTEVAPEVTPDVTTEAAPEVELDLATEAAPETAPEAPPIELFPEETPGSAQ